MIALVTKTSVQMMPTPDINTIRIIPLIMILEFVVDGKIQQIIALPFFYLQDGTQPSISFENSFKLFLSDASTE